MSLYNLIKEKLVFSIKNKLVEPRETLIEILKRVKEAHKQRKRKLSDIEIRAIAKKYIQEQRKALNKIKADSHKHIIERRCTEGNIAIAELVICGFANDKRADK